MSEEFCTECSAQISRLKSKPFFDTKGREGVAELISTLHRYGHSRARQIIDEALLRRWGQDGSDSAPSPSDIWGLSKMDSRDFQSAEPEESKLPSGCLKCGGSDWVIVSRGMYEGAARCDCERGQYLAARDRERRAA